MLREFTRRLAQVARDGAYCLAWTFAELGSRLTEAEARLRTAPQPVQADVDDDGEGDAPPVQFSPRAQKMVADALRVARPESEPPPVPLVGSLAHRLAELRKHHG